MDFCNQPQCGPTVCCSFICWSGIRVEISSPFDADRVFYFTFGEISISTFKDLESKQIEKPFEAKILTT